MTEVVYTPSGDTTGSTDSTKISGYLSSGDVVVLDTGNYYLNAPLTIPDQGVLISHDPSWGVSTGNYGAGSLPLQGSILNAGSSFSGTEMIVMGSSGTTQHGGQRLYGITIDGSALPSGANGIYSVGYVAGVKMRDVLLWKIPNNGLYLNNDGNTSHTADFWQVDSCKFSDCGGWGVATLGLSDSWFVNSESTGNTAGGWWIKGGADTRFGYCRADSNTGTGWDLIPSVAANQEFTNCEAVLNNLGWKFEAGSAMNYYLANCIAHDNTTEFTHASGSNVVCVGGNFTV